jgi:hypothetical protein
MKPIETLAKDLNLGDIVRLRGVELPYSSMTVYNKTKDGTCHVRRPYIQTEDFSYTGGVLNYIGLEDFTLSPETTVLLLKKGGPLK